MTTLELFKKHRKGEVSRERFLYEVRRDNNLPWITNTTSYNDAVKILKNKGIIRESAVVPENTLTVPQVDRVNPYFLKKGVEKELENKTDLNNNSYEEALNKAANKLAKNPHAFDDLLIHNASEIHKKDEKLQMKAVKKGNHVDKDREMKKMKGQETLKAQSAPTKENRKGKPKGVKVMPDKGVTGSQKIIKEVSEFIKKSLSENSLYHEFHTGMEVETPHGTGIIKEINGGTLTVECGGQMYDVQMNTIKHFMEKKNEVSEIEDSYGYSEEQNQPDYYINVSIRDASRAIEIYRDLNDIPQGAVKMDGTDSYVIDDLEIAQELLDAFQEEDIEIVDTDVPSIEDSYEEDYEEDDLAEARNINDPALVNARAKIVTPQKSIANHLDDKDRDFEIEMEIRDLKRQYKRTLIDMEQEAEPEGGPIADDYADRLMDLERQIKALEAKLSIHEDELEETADVVTYMDAKTGKPEVAGVYRSGEGSRAVMDLKGKGVTSAKVNQAK